MKYLFGIFAMLVCFSGVVDAQEYRWIQIGPNTYQWAPVQQVSETVMVPQTAYKEVLVPKKVQYQKMVPRITVRHVVRPQPVQAFQQPKVTQYRYQRPVQVIQQQPIIRQYYYRHPQKTTTSTFRRGILPWRTNRRTVTTTR